MSRSVLMVSCVCVCCAQETYTQEELRAATAAANAVRLASCVLCFVLSVQLI
jgi:hypothetical protein